MTRDWDLLRQLLLAHRVPPVDTQITARNLEVEPAVVSRHLQMLSQSGLVEPLLLQTVQSGAPEVLASHGALTWHGHELLSLIADPAHWQRVRDQAHARDLPLTVHTIQALCEERCGTNGDPTPMLLWCPACRQRHVDVGEFATRPHHTHACQHCGMVWRPALVATVGVDFLPGFRDE